MTAAKVICMFAGSRRSYNNNAQTAAAVLELWKHTLALEQEVDPGYPTDTILVHNQDDCAEAREMLSALHWCPTKRGVFRYLPRPNAGGSFGAFLDAFKTFRAEYDHFMFMEDDVYMISDGYLAAAVEQLQTNPLLGFVALAPICEAGEKHSGGGFGVTTTERMDFALPFMNIALDNPPSYPSMEHSEVEFTTAFVRAGMTLDNLKGSSPFSQNWQVHNSQAPRFQEDNLPRIYRVGL